jgi:hypothetical protein
MLLEYQVCVWKIANDQLTENSLVSLGVEENAFDIHTILQLFKMTKEYINLNHNIFVASKFSNLRKLQL